MRTINGDALVVDDAGDLHVLVRNREYGSGIFPAHIGRHGKYNYTGTGMSSKAIGSIVRDGDLAGIAQRINHNGGAADALHILKLSGEGSFSFYCQVDIGSNAIHIIRYPVLVIGMGGYF